MKFRRPSPRTWIKLFALLCALWCFWHPRRMDALFSAIPFEATAVSYHVSLASEWKSLSRNEAFRRILERAGVPDAHEIVEDPGIYQTVFWLTGRDTVMGYVPYARGRGAFDDAYLAAASHVGWKAKFMELLWRVKWIPGLGRMESTPSGTRYMRFDDLVDSQGRELLLGLDIVDGMLLATLSTNPETVRLLANRVMIGVRDEYLAAAYLDGRPWNADFRGVRHALWAADPRILNGTLMTATIGSLQGPGFGFTFRGKLDEPALADLHRFSAYGDLPSPGIGVSAAAVPLLVVFDAAVVNRLGDSAPPVGRGLAAAYLSGKPNEGRLMGFAYPSLNAVLPWAADEAFKGWVTAWSEAAKNAHDAAKLRTQWSESANAATLLLSSSNLDWFGRAKPEDMAFLELEGGQALNIGSHYGSYRRRRASSGSAEGLTLAEVTDAWRSAHPSAFAAWRADMPTLHGELRHLGAIAKFVGSMVGGQQGAKVVDTVNLVETVLAAMTPLGVVDGAAFAEPDGWVRLEVRAQGTDSTPALQSQF